MSSPRLLVGVVAAAVASAALPATSSATIKRISAAPTPDTSAQYGQNNPTYLDQDGYPTGSWTQDGILAPGESVNVDFPLVDDTSDPNGPNPQNDVTRGQLFESGSSYLTMSDPSGGAYPTLRNWTPDSGTLLNNAPYTIKVADTLTCGTNIPLRLSFPTTANGARDITYGLPTGAPGAFHTTQSYDIGNIVGDGGTKDSKATVADDGLLKGLRIHIGSLVHQYSTHWLKIKLVGPDGTSVMLFDQAGSVAVGNDPGNKTLTNVFFSEAPVNGQNPVDASVAAQSNFNGSVIKPVDSFSVFDGKNVKGDWHLVVSDVKVAADDRANHSTRGRTLSGQDQMFQLGKWDVQDATATCSPKPQAWFPDPLIVDPAGGTIDASGSYAPVPGRTIKSYTLDLGNGSGPVTQTSPIFTVPPHAAGKVNVTLSVTDSTNATSDPVTKPLIYTKAPVFDANVTPAPTPGNLISVDPASPKAGQQVTLKAHATDAETTDSSLIYAWDLNDDGVFNDGNTPTVTYTWPTSGPHIVRVLVTDGDGAKTLDYQTVTIANLPPTAKFTYTPSTVAVVGEPVLFDGSTSTDSDGNVAEWDWDLDQSGNFQTRNTTATQSYTFSQAGDYLVRMRAIDNTGGMDEAQAMIHVTGKPVGVITASPSSPQTNETVTFSASGSHDSDDSGSIAKYEWDLDGNGSWDVTGATATTATRAYPNAGTVAVKLRVTDNDGATSVTTLTVVVRNPATGGGGGLTGGGTVTPTPTPAPTKTGSGGGGGLISNPTTTTLFPNVPTEAAQSGNATVAESIAGTTPSSIGSTPKGFVASIATGAKQHGSKTFKKGVAVNFKANTAGTLTVNLMVLPKAAKTVGLKLKGTKLVKIGSGKVVAKKAGTYKFTVVVATKYQKYVKKAKKLPVELRAVATSKDTGETLAIGKKFTYVK